LHIGVRIGGLDRTAYEEHVGRIVFDDKDIMAPACALFRQGL
jgi:hypothetical protein